jgi:hypothetical protein
MTRPGKANTKHISAETFEAVRAILPLTFSARRVDVARAVLVEGSTYQAAADRFGGTRQDAHKATTIVWAAHERYQAAERAKLAGQEAPLPEGWERVTLDAPTELIEQLRQKLQEYARDAKATEGDASSRSKIAGSRRKKTRPANGEPG